MRLFVFALFSAAGLFAAPDRPNILWVVSEDNSPEYIGAYGNPIAHTPHIDGIAAAGIRFDHVYTAPICAPSRSTIITGAYASSLGTQHMRSERPLPHDVRFFPEALREAGYYCSNNNKTDYNTSTPWSGVWDESSPSAHWRNRAPGQPFFAVFNFGESHESRIFQNLPLQTSPEFVRVPAYLPDTPAVRSDLARYQDCVNRADAAIGQILTQLEADGLADDTIIFYYSDHGGAVVGSKRFLNEAGTRAAMATYFPPKYAHLAPSAPGTHNQELIHFVDLAPTVLSLAGIAPLPQFQGRAFAGPDRAPAPEFTYMYADRMDERYHLVRAVTDGRYRYIRNYHPDRPWGQWSDFLWRMASTEEWDLYHRRHLTTPAQSHFFAPAPAEALYDIKNDPDNVRNLANDPALREQLPRFRAALREHLLSIRDTGFLPEPMMIAQAGDHSPRIITSDESRYPLADLIDWLDAVQLGGSRPAPRIDPVTAHPVQRYWLAAASPTAPLELLLLYHDPIVRFDAAESLLLHGESSEALAAFETLLGPTTAPEVKVFALNALARANPALSDDIANRLGEFAASPAWGGNDYFLARLSRHLLTDHRKPAFILNVENTPSTFTPPYPQSEILAGLSIDWTTHERHAPDSDNFQLARAANTITLGDDLYRWTIPDVSPGKSHRNHYEMVELARSTDHGANWTRSDWRFTQAEQLTSPSFLSFGRGHTDVPSRMNGYVYSYFVHPETPTMEQMGPHGRGLTVQIPGHLYLARVRPDQLFESRDTYEFFAGLDTTGQPRWGDPTDKQPVFSDLNGVGWCMSASYHPASDRVMLTTEHGISRHGHLGFFDAPNPWGPWTTISYLQPDNRFGAERPGSKRPWRNNIFFAAFPTERFDGDTFTLTFIGSDRGTVNDAFNTVQGTFLRPDVSTH